MQVDGCKPVNHFDLIEQGALVSEILRYYSKSEFVGQDTKEKYKIRVC